MPFIDRETSSVDVGRFVTVTVQLKNVGICLNSKFLEYVFPSILKDSEQFSKLVEGFLFFSLNTILFSILPFTPSFDNGVSIFSGYAVRVNSSQSYLKISILSCEILSSYLLLFLQPPQLLLQQRLRRMWLS